MMRKLISTLATAVVSLAGCQAMTPSGQVVQSADGQVTAYQPDGYIDDGRKSPEQYDKLRREGYYGKH